MDFYIGLLNSTGILVLWFCNIFRHFLSVKKNSENQDVDYKMVCQMTSFDAI